MVFDKDDVIDSIIRPSAANKGALRVLGTNNSPKSGGTQFVNELSGGGESR